MNIKDPRVYIYGITGRAGSGKSTFAKFLASQVRDSYIVPFAKPVKDFASAMGWNGEKDEKGRRLLQLIGTECGRECIGEDVWVDHWLREVERIPIQGLPALIIVDDLRFDNEAACIKALGGTIIKITGRNVKRMAHASEQGISNDLIDYRVMNTGNIKKLQQEAAGYGNIIRSV